MTAKDEALDLVNLIGGIDDVMTEDCISHVTRKQILEMGRVADGKIARGKDTAVELVAILDEIKLGDPISQDQLKSVGGLVMKAGGLP